MVVAGYFALNLIFGIYAFRMKKTIDESEALTKYGKTLQTFVKQYRREQHNNKNRIQMVLELNRAKDGTVLNRELSDYVLAFFDSEVKSGNVIIIDDDVILSAMINLKQEYANLRNINFSVNSISPVGAYGIPSAELTDVLLNLVDNAFEEVEMLDPENRSVSLSFYKDSIEVSNRVSYRVMKSGTDKFFEDGYSTKPNRTGDRGYGLSNVLLAARKYKIDIKNELDDGWVVFRLDFNNEIL
jgi:sensor histidine kinase regulating citrate/malate metabolism